MLDLEVVKLVVHRRSNEDLLKMKGCLDKRNQALQLGNCSESIDSNIQFHLVIAKASKNDVLYELYQTITPKLQTILSGLILKISNYNDNTNIHVQLFNSILNQNAKAAEKFAIVEIISI